MDALEAIRRRRSVRRYRDDPVPDETVDRLLRLALLAPTESMAQAWSFVVVRDRRADLADLVVSGGGEYFRIMRSPDGAGADAHAAWALGLGTLPTNFHGFAEDRFRDLLGLPPEVSAPIITPLGRPVEFPEALPPALAAARRPWRTLVHDERWEQVRA